MADVVYKPVSLPDKADINAPKEIDKPDYDDIGVSFKRYSKTPTGNKEYQLNPQEQADPNFSQVFTGGETSMNMYRTNYTSKDFYCTDLVLSGVRIGAAVSSSYFMLRDGTSVKMIIAEPSTSATWTMNFQFKTPIKFSKNNAISFLFNLARGAGDTLYCNFFGWEE